MYKSIENWISLDRNSSPTTASTNLYNALVAAGAKPVNLGQGREIVELPLLQKLTIEACTAGGMATAAISNVPEL